MQSFNNPILVSICMQDGRLTFSLSLDCLKIGSIMHKVPPQEIML